MSSGSSELDAKRTIVEVDIRKGKTSKGYGFVATEVPVHIHVNNEHYVTILASPTMTKELAVGHLLAEGVAKRLEDITKVAISGRRVRATLPGVDARVKASRILRLVTTACGGSSDYLKLLDAISKPLVKSDLMVSAEKMAGMLKDLHRVSTTHQKTRGTHVAALFGGNGKLVCSAEDVGRHNAVDKVIGWAALHHREFGDLVLVSSGRLTGDMVLKAARVGIPIVVSLTAPTDSGIRVAERTGVTIIGLATVARVRVYTHPKRVVPG